jgi:histidinol phosphatase-like PHP family hydrolase
LVYDFHTHTFNSDGQLSPVELIRYAQVRGYKAIGISDHVGLGNLEATLRTVIRDCALCERHWDIQAIPGAELTHVPAKAIHEAARIARELGAKYVVVHGETIAEPVEPGTNYAAVTSPYVDILAHPGLITLEEAQLAVRNAKFIEISARKYHSLTNGHVVKMGRQVGARFLVNSDAHEGGDLLTGEFARKVALGAGLGEADLEGVLVNNPQVFLTRMVAIPT